MSAATKTLTLMIFGDSVFRGVMLDAQGCYHSSEYIGFSKMAQELGIEIQNRAMPTFTVEQGAAYAQRLCVSGAFPDAVLLEFGGNDCDYKWSELDPHAAVCTTRTPLPRFCEAYTALIHFFQRQGTVVTVTEPTPFCPSVYRTWLLNSGVSEQQLQRADKQECDFGSRHQKYVEATGRLARENGCGLLQLNHLFAPDPAFFNPDGIHPNARGYRLIGDAIRRYLAEWLQIE